MRRYYNRHRWRVEGSRGEAKTQHGLHRAVRRGLDNVAIQVHLTAAFMNLKRPARAVLLTFFVMRAHLAFSARIKRAGLFIINRTAVAQECAFNTMALSK